MIINNQKNKEEQVREQLGRQAGGSAIFGELNHGEKSLGRKAPGSQAAFHIHNKGKSLEENICTQ